MTDLKKKNDEKEGQPETVCLKLDLKRFDYTNLIQNKSHFTKNKRIWGSVKTYAHMHVGSENM